MKNLEHSGLLRPTTQPVALPWDERPTQMRRLGVWIAALILIGTVAGGLMYQHLWEDVGHEITRILPASTTTFVRISDPLLHLEQAGQLDRWSDPEALRERWRSQGALSGAVGTEIAGVPLRRISAILKDLTILEFAVVPTPSGSTTLLFAQFGNSATPGRLLQDFGDRAEVIDRLLGFDIVEINAAPPWLPWGAPRSPIHATLMDDRFVLSMGPVDALEDLIEARVGGSSRPIRRRSGFDALSVQRDRTGFWAHLDEGVVFDTIREVFGPMSELPFFYRAALSEALNGLTIRSGIQHGDDGLNVRIQLAPTVVPPWPSLEGQQATGGAHTLLKRMPISMSSVWSLSVENAEPMLKFVEGLEILSRDARSESESPRARQRESWTTSVAILATVLGQRRALTGDVLLASGSTEIADRLERPVDWVLVLGVQDTALLADALPEAIERMLAEGWTCGSVRTTDGELHIAHKGQTSWFWRHRGDVLVVSGSERTLDLVGDWHPDQGSGGDEKTLQQSLRNVPTDSPLLVVLDPTRYRHYTPPSSAVSSGGSPPPWHELLTLDLRPEFRLAAALHVQDDGISIQTNLGIWTILAELAATDLDTLETRMIDDLRPACRAAYGTMCASMTDSPLCANFLPGRARVVARACARLKARGLLQEEGELQPGE